MTGIIQEGCTNSNATVTNLRAVAERSLELGGVPLVYECHANCRSIVNPDQECISSIAAFLVGAGPNAYWGFGSWVEEGSVEPPLTERWGPIFEVSSHVRLRCHTKESLTSERTTITMSIIFPPRATPALKQCCDFGLTTSRIWWPAAQTWGPSGRCKIRRWQWSLDQELC